MSMTKEQFLTLFFSQLNENGVDYFVYGEYRYLPRDTGGSDIDIVIADKDFKKTIQILKKSILNNGVVLVSSYANANANGNFFRFLTLTWGVQLDIFKGGLFYKGVLYYAIESVRSYIIEYNGINVLNMNKGFLVGYFKEIVHNGKSKEKYRKAVLDEFGMNEVECKKDIEKQFGKDVLTLIEQNLSLEGLNIIGDALKTALKRKILKGHLVTLFKARIVLLKRFFQHKPGYVIVVEGTDGSGKSFIIDSITPWLNECFHNGVVYNHLRPNLIPDLGVVLGKKKALVNGETPKVCDNPHAKKQSGLVGSFVRWSYYLFDYSVGYLKKVWKEIHRTSKVFVFDRYYYDYYIDQKRSRTRLPKIIIKLGELFVPSPDLILCLGGNPEKIFSRKPETSLNEVSRQVSALKDFCHKRKNAVWIDTTMLPEESISNAKSAILQMMSNKFSIE